MPVARAQHEIDSREFSDWCAFLRMEDDPDDVRLARFGMVQARLAGHKRVTADMFMPRKLRSGSDQQTAKAIKARVMCWAKAHNQKLKQAEKRKNKRRRRGD